MISILREPYVKITSNQFNKIGNSINYIIDKTGGLSKIKILNLIYVLDELSIKKSGIPFFNIKYKVWKQGPISEELFVELSSNDNMFENYIERSIVNDKIIINKKGEFSDDEFSDNDIELMDFVIDKFGSQCESNLMNYTHRKNSPWYKAASDNSVLELLDNESISNTDINVNMSLLINHDDRKKLVYKEYIEQN